MRGGDSLRIGVHPNLDVAEVAVVEKHQVGLASPGQRFDRRPFPADVGLHGIAAGQPVRAKVVQADCHAVGAQRRVFGRRALQHVEPRIVAFGVDVEIWAYQVHPGGLQPLLGELRQVASAGPLKCAEKIGEGRVAPLMLAEVATDTGKELRLAHVGDQLFEH